MKVKASGIPAHASMKILGVNAIDMLFNFLVELYKIEAIDRKLSEEVNGIIDMIQPSLKRLESLGIPKEVFNNLFKRLSVSVGTIRGGKKSTLYPPTRKQKWI